MTHRSLRQELEHIKAHLRRIEKKEIKIMAELETLRAAVARNTSVVDSAMTLLKGLKSALDAAIASNDPAALAALSAELGTSSDALAASVVANTPAA